MVTVLLLLRRRAAFWEQLETESSLTPLLVNLIGFIILASALYGAALAGWRAPRLSLYVAVKLPLLLLGTTAIVSGLNWVLAVLFGSGLSFRQVMAVTYGAMGLACWILLSLLPVTLFFTFFAASYAGSPAELRFTHNCLLLTHIVLIAMAGVAGNQALRQGLRRLVSPKCATEKLYWSWIAAFAFVGCQLSWILRPFVGSPFYPVAFLRPDCLNRNFYEFVFLEVLPYVLRGGH